MAVGRGGGQVTALCQSSELRHCRIVRLHTWPNVDTKSYGKDECRSVLLDGPVYHFNQNVDST